MKALIVIPARYASVRFPGKPLALVQGKPMIQRTYEQALKTGYEVVVATDDERISSTVQSFGGLAFMTSSKHPNGTTRVAEAVDLAEEYNQEKYDIVVNVQGDEPFVHPEDIEKTVKLLKEEKGTIATLCKQITIAEELHSPNTVKVVKTTDNKALYFSRVAIPFLRSIDPNLWLSSHAFYKHIGLYAFRRQILTELICLQASYLESCESLEQLRWLEHGYSIAVAETALESIGIDTPEDLERANKV